MNDDYLPKMEIELIKKDVGTITALFEKFDTTLTKMQEIASDLTRLVSLQEQRLNIQEKETSDVQKVLEMRRIEHNGDIKELHSRITITNRELSDKIEETEKKILKELHEFREEMKKKPDDSTDSAMFKRLTKLESWQYMVIGGLMVVTWIAAKIDLVKILFSR